MIGSCEGDSRVKRPVGANTTVVKRQYIFEAPHADSSTVIVWLFCPSNPVTSIEERHEKSKKKRDRA